jgi:hypothetical protein
MINKTLTYDHTTYEWLRWTVQIALPAVATLYFALGTVWDFPNPERVVATITAITTFLGVTLGISKHNYDRSDARYDGTFQIEDKVVDSRMQTSYKLDLNADPEELAQKKDISFKVSSHK